MMNTALHRRTFLAASTACLAGAPLLAAAAQKLPIVDTHLHLWDLRKFRLSWINDELKGTIGKNFLLDDYAQHTRGQNVVQAVYMEVDVDVDQQDAEIAFISELCRRGDSVLKAAVFSGRPASPQFGEYLARHRDNPYIRGLRQVLHGPSTPRGYCLEPAFVAGIRQLGKLGWSFDLCMRSTELLDAAKLIEQCPDTRFVLDHCGNARVQADDLSQWQQDIETLSRHKNVIGKVSGIIASAKRDQWTVEQLAKIVNHTLGVFGPDRVVFGGDWPVCLLGAELAQWIEALRTIIRARPVAEQQKLLHDNAVAFYRLM